MKYEKGNIKLFHRWLICASFFFILQNSYYVLSANAYWQQHVRYDIRVTLIDSIHTLEGMETVIYSNNSPDTLSEIYFHLYSNAFQPGSLMDERAQQLHTYPILDRIKNLPVSEQGKYWIDTVTDGTHQLRFEITGTIMHVTLARPLAPGESITLGVPFRERIPRQIRRSGWMSREGVQYSMAQWYPKIAEHDEEGWHRQEYVSHEFYGVWGEFSVEITLPSRFTIGSSGECQNPSEVGHGYDRIAAGEKRGFALPGDARGGMTTWRFHANPVHDFAWVADDDYVHEWDTWRDTITLHSFYKSRYAGFWELKALDYTRAALQTYSDTFGVYQYRDFSTTMAGDGGMEYPQLIMITGYRPSPLSLSGVIAHEVGHQWFYGMLGSNETREAFMDEGFTTFATTIAMNAQFGDNQIVPGAESSWLDWLKPVFSNKSGNYTGYQQIASQQYEEPLDIPHDWLREDATGGQVYGKTGAILNMLEYSLGDSVFARGMKAYFAEWHFKHPHLVDFKNVMERVAHTDLDWFFDEWFRSTRTVDYEAVKVSSKPTDGGYKTTVRLRNKDLAVMPLDLLLHYDDGTTAAATIPLVTNKGAEYHKSGKTLFFPGWDWVAPDYRGSTVTPKRVSWFEIDTTWRLQDLHWLNNYSSGSGLWMPPGEWAVWKQLFLSPPLDRYYSVVRPIVWYNEPSKWNIGAGAKFGMNNGFSGDAKMIYNSGPVRPLGEAVPWYDYVDGALSYKTPVDWVGRLGTLGLDAEKMYGIATLSASLTKVIRPEYWRLGPTHTASFFIEDQRLLNRFETPVWHDAWGTRTPHVSDVNLTEAYGMHTQVAGIRYSAVSQDRDTRFDFYTEGSLWGSDASFALAKAQFVLSTEIGSNFGGKLRLVSGIATEGTPVQRMFSLGRANNYEEQSSGLFRSVSSMSRSFSNNASLFVEGGAGLRGFNSNGLDESGIGMLAGNFDLVLPNPLASLGSFATFFSPGLFLDAGWVGDSWDVLRENPRADAGVKITVKILSWLPSQLQGVAEEYAAIPDITINFPIYVTDESHQSIKPLAFRWAISIGSSF